jgi:hypothetical protein
MCSPGEQNLCQTCITALICLKGTLLKRVRRQEPTSHWDAAPAPVVTNCPTARQPVHACASDNNLAI